MNKILFSLMIGIILGIFLILSASAEKIPFTQCVDVLNADVDSITCYFSQGAVYTNQSMTADSVNNQYCIYITDSAYSTEGSYSYSVYCNDSSTNVILTDSFTISPTSTSFTPLLTQPVAGQVKTEISFFSENKYKIGLIVGFGLLAVFLGSRSRRK